jgi:hypothetical protein
LTSTIGKAICKGKLVGAQVFGIPVVDYCAALFRSTVLDDVRELFERLGFKPRTTLAALRYKNDGFWSCIWTMRFDSTDTLELLRLGLITQSRKRDAMARH